MSIPEISCDLMFFPSGVQLFALCYLEKTSLYVIVNIVWQLFTRDDISPYRDIKAGDNRIPKYSLSCRPNQNNKKNKSKHEGKESELVQNKISKIIQRQYTIHCNNYV